MTDEILTKKISKKFCKKCVHMGRVLNYSDGRNHTECDKNPIVVGGWKGVESVKIFCNDKNKYNDCADYEIEN